MKKVQKGRQRVRHKNKVKKGKDEQPGIIHLIKVERGTKKYIHSKEEEEKQNEIKIYNMTHYPYTMPLRVVKKIK